MKKLIAIATIITVAIMLSVAYAMPACAEEDDEFYTLVCAIIELDYTEDTVSCLDQAGNVWQFYGVEEREGELVTFRYHIGDVVVLTIWTPTDEIVAVDCIDHLDAVPLARWIRRACD